jgi:hypothetical protein
MSYASRLASIHGRARTKFGVNAAGEQLYVWHAGTQIACYQPGGSRGRALLNQLITRDETLTVHATKATFTAVPVPGDEIKMGTSLATAQTLRIDSVKTTHIRPFYEIEMIDPNVATTAAQG